MNRKQKRDVYFKGGELTETLTHSCGHVCRYEFVDPLPTVQGGLRIIRELPCLWCGPGMPRGAPGIQYGEKVPENVTRVVIPTPHARIMAVFKT